MPSRTTGRSRGCTVRRISCGRSGGSPGTAGKLTFITENQGKFRIALEASAGCLDALGLHVRADWPWVPMDGARLPELLVTFALQEMIFGSRYLTAHSNQTIERCRVARRVRAALARTYAATSNGRSCGIRPAIAGS